VVKLILISLGDPGTYSDYIRHVTIWRIQRLFMSAIFKFFIQFVAVLTKYNIYKLLVTGENEEPVAIQFPCW
jgi:hypothetical protein